MNLDQTIEVPLCDLQAQYRALRASIDAAVSRVFTSGQVILGPEVAALEREVAAYCGAAHGVGCASGSDALLLALHALNIGPGDEVIVPPFTFFATAGAICRTGATPVFADIDPDTFNIDPKQIDAKITSRTRAIMPVHLFGQCADMDAIDRIAQRRGVFVIEDAAQSFGSEYHGKKSGSLASLACFSYYPTKTLGTFGDGGMVTTDNAEWARSMARLRIHGMEPKYHHAQLGWNARLDAVHAAILRVKLPHVEGWIQARQAAARRYDALIASASTDGFLTPPVVRPNLRHTFNQYVVRVADSCRDALLRHLKSLRIGCEVYYPRPLHLQESLAMLGHREGEFPVSEAASRCVLALPMYPELTAEQQEYVIACCADFARKRGRLAA
ncbi:MAG: DegT/DnrJ/EryC1/StrS family aminotransferase [Gemmataceae bacterium]